MASKQAARAPKAPSRDRRTEILASAARVITERGLAETRVADIAKDAGVSTGLVLYYFDSKDKLLSEALAQLNDAFYLQVSRDLRGLDSARERIEHLIDLSVPDPAAEGDRVEEWALWIEVWVRALRDPQMAREREVLDRRFRDSLAEVIRGGQVSGEFPRGPDGDGDPDELALRLSAMIDGLAIQTVLGDTGVTPGRMKRAALSVAAREIGFETPAEA